MEDRVSILRSCFSQQMLLFDIYIAVVLTLFLIASALENALISIIFFSVAMGVGIFLKRRRILMQMEEMDESRTQRRSNSSNREISPRILQELFNLLESHPDRVRLLLNQEDFTGNDYEELLVLDERSPAAISREGLSEDQIQRIPEFTFESLFETPRISPTAEDIIQPKFAPSESKDHIRKGQEICHELESEMHNCAVCLCCFSHGELIRRLSCLHIFHRECIDPWLREKSVCPLCKLQINLSVE